MAQSAGESSSSSDSKRADNKKTQAHFDKGAEYYVQEKYARAIVEFRKGYRISQQPMFLLNIALAQAKLGQHDKALATSRQASAGLSGKAAVSNQGLGAACAIIVDANKRAEAIAEAAAASRADASTEDSTDPSTDKPSAVSDDSSFGVLGWTGAAALVLGGAALGGAGWTALDLDDDWAAYEAAGEQANTARYEQLRQDISQKQDRGQILLYTGAGLTIAGATLLAVEMLADEPDTQPAPHAYSLTPSAGADSVSIELNVGF
jgi:tetratricopeptide (TPR) repeat protein